MAEFPALPLFTDAWIADTKHLSRPERDIYLHLLIVMWRTPGCTIPNDRGWLLKHLGIKETDDAQGDAAILTSVCAEFCTVASNRLMQKRLFKEYNYLKRQSEAQSKRAKSRWNKEKHQYPEDASGTPPAYAPTPTPTPTPLKEKHSPTESAKSGSRLASDWTPDPGDIAFAESLGLKASAIAANFLDYWTSQPGAKGRKLSWSATWRIWCRKEAEQKPRTNGHATKANGSNGHRVVGYPRGSREWWEQVRDQRGYYFAPGEREKFETMYGGSK